MQQYFLDGNVQIGEQVLLNEEQAHHISHVLRMKQGDVVRVIDVQHIPYLATVTFEGKQVYALIKEQLKDETKLPVDLYLAQGLIKNDKWDYVLQKASELGVHTIYPFTSRRSVVKYIEDKKDKKLVRWNKICLEACEQSKRSTLVEVKAPCNIKDLINIPADLKIIAYEDADYHSVTLARILKKHHHVTSILFVIGCEGGFDVEEVAYLEEHGFLRVSLGSRILRAETAAVSVISTTGFYYEMIGVESDEQSV